LNFESKTISESILTQINSKVDDIYSHCFPDRKGDLGNNILYKISEIEKELDYYFNKI